MPLVLRDGRGPRPPQHEADGSTRAASPDSVFKQRTHVLGLAACFARVARTSLAPSWERAQGRPGAGWHPRSVRKGLHTGGPQARPGHPDLPCADGFNGFLRALLGETSSFAPVAMRIFARSKPGWARTPPQGLTPASGARTTRLRRPRAWSPSLQRLACAHR